MSWDNNPYYSPENFGLTPVAEMSWHEPCYDFDYTVAWTSEDGTLYWASDSGCSCPVPFEDYSSLDDLTTGTKFDLLKEVQGRLDASTYDQHYAQSQAAQFLEKVMAL